MAAYSSSYLTRRQRSYATTPGSHNNPHRLEPFSSGALVPNHERGSLPPSLGGGGRNRRRGSPFAALSEAYKPPRAAGFAVRGGRDRGEVLGLRSSNFSWPSVERLPADPRYLQRSRGEKSAAGAAGAETDVTVVASGSKKPALLVVRKQTDENAVESRWVSSSSSSSSSAAGGMNDDVVAGVDVDVVRSTPSLLAAAEAAAANVSAADTEAAPRTATRTATSPSPSPFPHRRSVSWGENIVHEFVINADQTQADVYSPDLLAVDIARRLAVLARDPELRRSASAVELCRRHASQAVRSLTADQNGGVQGVEEACRLCNWREAAFLRETDELVRCIVVAGGQKEVWRLKASYRTARRQMEDNRSE